MTTVPPAVPTQGYGKAIVGGLVQPFAGALAAVILYFVDPTGQALPSSIHAAITTLVETPITVLAIIYTPHNLFGGT